MSEALLSVEGLWVQRAGPPEATPQVLLKALSFSLRSAERVAVTGPSGSGKTTLLRTLAGLTDAPQGQILFRGQPLLQTDITQHRSAVMYVGQKPALIEGSVRMNLSRPFQYLVRKGRSFSQEKAIELLNALALPEDVLERDRRALSVGEQQRVALVRALLLEPAVLLLDEPTSALDEENRDRVWALLRAREPLAALIVTHANTDRADRVLDLTPFRGTP